MCVLYKGTLWKGRAREFLRWDITFSYLYGWIHFPFLFKFSAEEVKEIIRSEAKVGKRTALATKDDYKWNFQAFVLKIRILSDVYQPFWFLSVIFLLCPLLRISCFPSEQGSWHPPNVNYLRSVTLAVAYKFICSRCWPRFNCWFSVWKTGHTKTYIYILKLVELNHHTGYI